jgi:hypothetical protein
VFSRGWLEDPTICLILTLNVIQPAAQNTMVMNLVIIKNESGIYSLTYNTESSNLIVFDTLTKQILTIFILILDVLLIATALYDINEQRKEQALIDAAKRQSEIEGESQVVQVEHINISQRNKCRECVQYIW